MIARVKSWLRDVFREENDIERNSEAICRLGERIRDAEYEVIAQIEAENRSFAAMRALGTCYYAPQHDGVYVPLEAWEELKPHLEEMARKGARNGA